MPAAGYKRRRGYGRRYRRRYTRHGGGGAYKAITNYMRKLGGVNRLVEGGGITSLEDVAWVPIKRGGPTSRGYFGENWKTATEVQKANRRAFNFRGRGGYWGRKIGGMFGRADLGDTLGDAIGAGVRGFVPGGQAIMDGVVAAGDLASRFSGSGAYTSNALVDGGRDNIPTFAPEPDGASIIISHREYLGDIFGPPVGVNFQNNTYELNPGLEQSFPWLSQIACNYDEYELLQCMFTFRSTTTDIGSSTTGQCGTLVVATQYNIGAAPFADKETMMSYDAAMSCKTTEEMIHGVECNPDKLSGAPGKYIRTGPVKPSEDLKTYDHARVNIAVCNTPSGYAAQSLGEVWVSYTVKLRKPRFYAALGSAIKRDVFVNASCTSLAGMFDPSTTKAGKFNSIGTSVVSSSNGFLINFPSYFTGPLRISYFIAGGQIEHLWNQLTNITGNIKILSDQWVPNLTAPGTVVPAASTACGFSGFQFTVDVWVGTPSPGNPNTLQIAWGDSAITQFPTYAMLDIMQINANMSLVPGRPPTLVDESGNIAAS